MESHSPNFIDKLRTLIRYAELGGLLLALAGITLDYYHVSGVSSVVNLGGAFLAGSLFLSAYLPRVVDQETTEPARDSGFSSLLENTILPKIGGISSAICVVGLIFSYQHLNGANEMLIIGGTTAAVASVFALFYYLNRSSNKKLLEDILYRCLPLAIISIWWLLSQGLAIQP